MFNYLSYGLRNQFSFFTKIFFTIFVIHYGSVILLGEINSINRITYGIYTIFIFLLLIKHFNNYEIKLNSNRLQSILWLSIIFILYSFFINKAYLNLSWFVGDFLVFYSIIFSMVLGYYLKPEIFEKSILENLMVILFFILITDSIFSFFFIDESKIRSFSRLIIVPSFFIFQLFNTKENKYLYGTLLCFLLAIVSNMRYAFVIMILMIIAYSIYFFKNKIFDFFNLRNTSIMLLFLTTTTFILYENNVLQKWSFYYLFAPAYMGELGIVNVYIGRLYEVQDAYNQYLNQFNIGSFFFGNGFGASYKPNEFMRFFVAEYSSDGAVYENLRRHILHFGPARFFFRYGLIGLTLISYIFYLNISKLLSIYRSSTFGIDLFFSITLILYLLRFFLQPIFNDIMILFCLTGFFIHLKEKHD